MKNFNLILVIVITGLFFSCSHGDIQIENNIKDATLVNIEWGGLPLTDLLNSGDISVKRKIDNNDYYNIKLPESFPLSFFIITDSDTIFYETKEIFTIEPGKYTLITISEETELVEFSRDYSPI